MNWEKQYIENRPLSLADVKKILMSLGEDERLALIESIVVEMDEPEIDALTRLINNND